MTKIEKVMIGIIVFIVLLVGFQFYIVTKVISDAGGVHNIIVEAGKEVKQISKEINE